MHTNKLFYLISVIRYLNKEFFEKKALRRLANQYMWNKPYPHIAIDGLFNNFYLSIISHNFPDLKKASNELVRSGGPGGLGKIASREGCYIAKGLLKHLIRYLNSNEFVFFLSKVTRIKEPLIVDHSLTGGGIHSTSRGGSLKLHVDFPKHRANGLDRRLNVLVFLNKGWKEEWAGHFLAVGDDNYTKSYMPIFNRTVIFETNDNTKHGHPFPLNCPSNRSRNSIAMYYYSNGRPDNEIIYDLLDSKKNNVGRSTIYFDEPNYDFH